jgi:DNA-binding NarL/FixJ family response regulator
MKILSVDDEPGGGGARAAVQIREALPDVRIVAISADDSQTNQCDMMRAGAVGFITKGASDEEVLRVIRSSARWESHRPEGDASGSSASGRAALTAGELPGPRRR